MNDAGRYPLLFEPVRIGPIAACVRSGHEYAQEMDAERNTSVRREISPRGEGLPSGVS